MLKIIEPARTIETVIRVLAFDRTDQPGAGWEFDCDEDGNVDESKLNANSRHTLELCRRGIGVLPGRRIVTYRNTYRQARVVQCCSSHFELSGFTNTCPECSADYNWAGQRLAPREQWGEETGEHWADIANLR